MSKITLEQQHINRIAQNLAQLYLQTEIDKTACNFFERYKLVEYDITVNPDYKIVKQKTFAGDDFFLVKKVNRGGYYIFHYMMDTEYGVKYEGFHIASGFADAFQKLEQEIERKNQESVYVDLLKKALKVAKF